MIGRDLKKAITQSLMGKYIVYVIQLLSISILARLFTPEEFGFIASVQVFILFFQMLSTSGLAPAVIYQNYLSPTDRNGIFSFTVILGSILVVVFLSCAPLIHMWFGYNEDLYVFYLLALAVLFSAMSMLPLAALQKDAKFLIISRCELFSELISLLICFLIFPYFESMLALSIKFLMVPVFRFVFYFIYSSKSTIGRPKFGKSISSVLPLLPFARYQLGFNIVNFFSRNLDTILVAKYFGVASLGFYEKTYQLMRYPLQLFTFSITPALQPILTKYRDNPLYVCDQYYRLAYKLAFIGLFTFLVFLWGSEDIIFLLFGDQWLPASEYLRILSLTIPLQMVLSSTGGVFQAFGATKDMLICGVFSAFTNVIAISLGIYHNDLSYLCIYLCISFSMNFIQCFYILHSRVFSFERGVSLVLISLVMLPFIIFYIGEYGYSGGYVGGYYSSFLNLVYFSFLSALFVSILYFFLRLKIDL